MNPVAHALEPFYVHFGSPQGVLGRVAGRVMAFENTTANRAVLDALSVGRQDVLLDVGCGPGVAVAMAAPRARFAAGVDPSRVMVAQACGRVNQLIQLGRAQIAQAPAERLPFADATFSAAMAVNSIQHWQSPQRGLRELHRVLAPSGRLVIARRGRRGHGSALDPHANGAADHDLTQLRAWLADAGFGAINQSAHGLRRETLVTFTAVKSADACPPRAQGPTATSAIRTILGDPQ